jgi:hydroxymethylpyrimidine pyrophosphatase-like HAD family hydrolase
MRYTAVALDFDGTIAHDSEVPPHVVEGLRRLKDTGRKLLLVTGRELPELLAIFKPIDIFDRVVAENGALLYRPATGERVELGEAPPAKLVALLRERGVPISVGQSIIATVEPHETVVLQCIRELGLERPVIFNKGAVMILPPGINKASGLARALGELGLSPRNLVAAGDAENDHALLDTAEYSVAVANAITTLKEAADRVTDRHARRRRARGDRGPHRQRPRKRAAETRAANALHRPRLKWRGRSAESVGRLDARDRRPRQRKVHVHAPHARALLHRGLPVLRPRRARRIPRLPAGGRLRNAGSRARSLRDPDRARETGRAGGGVPRQRSCLPGAPRSSRG